MPVCNDENFIEQAIESLLSQTFSDFTLIISDNASTDNTSIICKQFADKDPRVVYTRRPINIGALQNFAFVLKAAKSKYFMWAASDDFWDHDFIENSVNALETNQDSVMAFCPYALVDDAGKILSIHKLEYSSKMPIARITKFAYAYDDRCFYALYRRNKIANITWPIWWGRNRHNPMNQAYPFLFYVLTTGDYSLVGDRPMWFYRTHQNESERRPDYNVSENMLLNHLYLHLRVANVFWESLNSIYQASGSLRLTISASPVLFIRGLYVSIYQFFHALFKYIQYLVKR
jgi:glycosyltransferase involved in cell wall biosynthesis